MHVSNTLNKQKIDYYLPDDWSMNKVAQALSDIPEWLRAGQIALTKAIKFSGSILGKPEKMSPRFRLLLFLYFGVPRDADPAQCTRVITLITPALLQTLHGMSLPEIEIADVSQMPWIAQAQRKCMGLLSELLEKPQGELAGVVFESYLESTTRAISEYFSPRSFFSPKEGRINLNFDLLWRESARAKDPSYSVKTLLHEATHKFAHTLDKHYFPDQPIYDSFEKNIDLNMLFQDSFKTFEELAEDAWKKTKALPSVSGTLAAVEKLSLDDLVKNADGIANRSYAWDVAALSTEIKEMKKAIKAVMKPQK